MFSFAKRTASSIVMGSRTSGTTALRLCLAADSAMVCQRWVFFAILAPSSLATLRRICTGMISAAPSSTAFCTIRSILSDLGSPWKRYTFTGSSTSDSLTKRSRHTTSESVNSSMP